jgi:toxin HigB-1
MIRSYKDKRTERFADGGFVKAFEAFDAAAERKLAMLHEANSLDVLRRIPGNRLERLRGKRTGQHSIRINDQWRICFVWDAHDGCADQVEIVDYH